MNNDFSIIKDYADLRVRLNALSAEIAESERKLTSWKTFLLPLVRRLRSYLSAK